MKGEPTMNWNQIEDNWLAMTRRIRPDRLTTKLPIAGASNAAQNPGDMAEITVDWPEADIPAVSVARLIA